MPMGWMNEPWPIGEIAQAGTANTFISVSWKPVSSIWCMCKRMRFEGKDGK